MFFVSGSRSSTREHGYVLPLTCPRCKTVGYWRLVQETNSTTVYFVAVNPSDNYHIYCEKCGYSVQLNPEQAQRAFYLRDSTHAFFNKQISEEEYGRRLKEMRYLQ